MKSGCIKKKSYACNRPRRPIRLWAVEAPSHKLCRQWQMAVMLSDLYASRFLPPGTIPGTLFCWRQRRPQWHYVAGRIESIEKSKGLIGNRARDLPACSVVPQPTTLPHVPNPATLIFVCLDIFLLWLIQPLLSNGYRHYYSLLLGGKSSGSHRRDPSRWPRGTLYPQNVVTNFADKWRSLGRYSSLADSGHGVLVFLSWRCRQQVPSKQQFFIPFLLWIWR
jgi:hypothetical protein